MTLMLRLSVLAACIILALYVLHLVSKGKLLLKYSLLWLSLALVLLLSAAFPNGVAILAHLIGFEMAANFIYFIGMFCLMVIALSLTVIVSRQAKRINVLVQRLALLEYRMESKTKEPLDSMRGC